MAFQPYQDPSSEVRNGTQTADLARLSALERIISNPDIGAD